VPINGMTARRVENAWQYSKVYPEQVDPITGVPSPAWFRWRDAGYACYRADRYPMGKGAVPSYTYLLGEQLTYIEARSRLYIPMYAWAARRVPEWEQLQALYRERGQLTLVDFDAYDHRRLGYDWFGVLTNESRKMGHGFVLAMMLEGVC
jgi:hypothetical protein